jgi:hypothetical protein
LQEGKEFSLDTSLDSKSCQLTIRSSGRRSRPLERIVRFWLRIHQGTNGLGSLSWAEHRGVN